MAKKAITLTPTELSEKWNKRLKAAVTDIQRGVDAVDVSPGQKAAKKLDKAKQNYIAAIDSGRMAKALNAVNLDEWKANTKKKVAERLSGGVDAAMSKRQAFDQYLVSTINQVLPKIDSMPDLTLQDSLARVQAFMEHMSNNPYKK